MLNDSKKEKEEREPIQIEVSDMQDVWELIKDLEDGVMLTITAAKGRDQG